MSDVNLTGTESARLCICSQIVAGGENIGDGRLQRMCDAHRDEVVRLVADRERAARAAALAPIQALAGDWESRAIDDAHGSDGFREVLRWASARLNAALAAAGVDAAPNETAEIAERSDPAWTFDLMVKDGSITREAADLALGRMRQQDAGVVVPDSVWRARHSPSALAAALDEVRAQALRDAAADLDDDRRDVKRLLLARAAVPSGHEQEGDRRG